MSAGGILIVVLLGLLAYVVLAYNRLITLKNRYLNAFSQIDVQLQRRHELIPNLVEIASTYIKHERETLVAVTEARNTAESRRSAASANPQDSSLVGSFAAAESQLTEAMGRLNLVMEAYPDLKADERMADLHEELASTENRVTFSRQAYSDAVMRYNTDREQIPTVLVANAFSFGPADLFEIDNKVARDPIKVSFA